MLQFQQQHAMQNADPADDFYNENQPWHLVPFFAQQGHAYYDLHNLLQSLQPFGIHGHLFGLGGRAGELPHTIMVCGSDITPWFNEVGKLHPDNEPDRPLPCRCTTNINPSLSVGLVSFENFIGTHVGIVAIVNYITVTFAKRLSLGEQIPDIRKILKNLMTNR